MTDTYVAASSRPTPSGARPSAAGPLRSGRPAVVRLVVFAAVMAALLAAAAFPQSSFFTISTITVHGAQQLSEAELITRSGLYRGQRIASIDPPAVAARLEALPWVATARVHVSPAGQVHLVITERIIAAALPYRQRYVLLDPDGVAIAFATALPSVPLITIDGITIPWLRLGDHVPAPGVREAVVALALMPPEEVARGLQLHVDRAGAVTVRTDDAVTVLLGQPRGLGAHAAVLPQVLAAVRRQHLRAASVDLRYAGSVILRSLPAPAGRGIHR